MAERKQEPSFTVTDRRLFTSDGELRTDVTDQTEKPKPATQAAPPKENEANHASPASLYMTAMMQLGLMHEQGAQPRVDIIGARQTIDTLSLIAEKTKGNLTAAEQNFLQNSLYELRMAYVEVTNALSRPPAVPATGTMGR
jgi:hypothetical protein